MSTDPAPPLSNGRYQLRQVLGHGGMATVYRAYDSRLDVWRAVKVLTPRLAKSNRIRRRFDTEARTTARLHHPHIVTVHDVGADEDRLFMVMELLEGGTMEQILHERGALTPNQALEVIRVVLSGLELAHNEGIVHRDIKPANVLLDATGRPKLADFGIARVVNAAQSLTRTGSSLGTWAYMAPEQRNDSKTVDNRADLFGVAATLYALVTNRIPYDLYAVEVHAEALESIPESISAIIRRGCHYNKEQRYSDAAEMRAAIEALQGDFPPEPVPPLGEIAGDGLVVDEATGPKPAPDPEQAPSARAVPIDALPTRNDPVVDQAPAPKAPDNKPLVIALVGIIVMALLALAALVWANQENRAASTIQPATVTRPAAFARLTIDSQPGSDVIINGVVQGATPWVGRIEGGDHALSLVASDGRRVDLNLTIVSGDDVDYCWDFDANEVCPR